MNTILSYVITFSSGLAIGIFGNYYAARLVDKAKLKDVEKERKRKFQEIQKKMPKLIGEMIEDFKIDSLKGCREFFIVTSKRVVFNCSSPSFLYYEDEHANLRSNIRILEMNGFVIDISEGKSPKYQFREEFVDLLK
ncbi:MAG TPA: hypothetical protein VFG54_12010 [Prolixibacteraceae bacterium]|nr:hypothetical protein [Prolixibacteraceae bacterium]